MNTHMNNRYSQMHAEVLNCCGQSGIRMIAGRRAAYEVIEGREINGIKEFLLMPGDMKVFAEVCAEQLKNQGYTVIKAKAKKGEFFRVYSEDMLAATVAALMKNPEGRHYPQFIIRGLAEDDGKYTYTSNGKEITFTADSAADLEEVQYGGSVVYMKKNRAEHLHEICGEEPGAGAPAAGYGLFSAECSADDFLKEAAKPGLLSQERIDRYNEYTAWRKENRTEIDKNYREYQEVLLGLKQP